MQPAPWQPPVELSEQEEQIVKRIRKAKLFVFLRKRRHELLDEAFQQELAGHNPRKRTRTAAYRASTIGPGEHPPSVHRSVG
jgi:hypothetical protein